MYSGFSYNLFLLSKLMFSLVCCLDVGALFWLGLNHCGNKSERLEPPTLVKVLHCSLITVPSSSFVVDPNCYMLSSCLWSSSNIVTGIADNVAFFIFIYLFIFSLFFL